MPFRTARLIFRIKRIWKDAWRDFANFLKENSRIILLVVLAPVAVCAVGEILVRVFSLDWRISPAQLYYQDVDLANHKPDPDPEILFRLKPGQYDYGKDETARHVHINAFGARGPERSAKKPGGVFRIIVIGGSNVYGSGVADDETWPAQLEKELNREARGRFEVWNMGVSSYVGVQMAAIGREAVQAYQPDLLIYAPSNTGAPAFLWGAPVKPYFDKHPSMWKGFFTPECLKFPPILSFETRLALVSTSALDRFVAVLGPRPSCVSWVNYRQEWRNAEVSRDFLEWARSRVGVCVFLYPGASEETFGKYTRGIDVPVLTLKVEGLPSEYREIHPPPRVLEWYAARIAAWLGERDLIPATAKAGV